MAVTPAASAQYQFDAWTTETGLPQNSIMAIAQTRDGYLWLGTFGGLVRFDGVQFTLVDDGLASSRILALFEDRAGSLWIGTEHGGLARLHNGQVTTYTAATGLPMESVFHVSGDRDGRIWLSDSHALVCFEHGRFTSYTRREGLPAAPTSRVIQDRDGRHWFGTRIGLVQFDAGRFTIYPTTDRRLAREINALYETDDGSLWIGTDGAGLARLRSGTLTWYTTADRLPSNWVVRVLADRAGNLWVGTEGGLAMLPHAAAGGERTFVAYTKQDGLTDLNIHALLEDREGNLWVGTDTGGLNRLKKRHLTTFSREEGLPDDVVVPITEDGEGTLWIGMTCGGLVRYRDGTFTTFGTKDGLPNACVWSLLADRDGALWVGTWGGGLSRLRDGRFTTYTTANSTLSSDAVLSLYQDRAGTVWVGTGAGLNRVNDGVFTVYRTKDGLVDDDVRFITEDRQGALWIGTTEGVSRFKDGTFTNYTTAEGLSYNFVRAIHETADGTLWFGTYGGGLTRLANGRFTAITTRHGLFENVVSRILEDDHGYFWMTGNRGIVRVKREMLDEVAAGTRRWIDAAVYGIGDGMKSSECNGGGQPAGWKARDGRLWFPTTKGVVMAEPRRMIGNRIAPPVLIRQVLVNRTERDVREVVEVPPGPGDLEIHYSGLSFSDPAQVRFKYRLAGLDADWIDAGPRRTAYYARLPPGGYTFAVMAATRDGVWSAADAATLRIQVVPPFYRTWWFMSLAGLTMAALVLAMYERRIRRWKRARIAQQAFSRRLIASQELERKRIAAELHDSLSQTLVVIKSRALLGLQAPDDHERTLDQMHEIADAATQAADEVTEIAYNLRPYHLDRLGLTRAIDAMLDKVSAVHGVRVIRELDAFDGVLPRDDEISVYRIVQEAVTNIVTHADATEARVRIARRGRRVTIAIEDNGRGFVQDAAAAARGGPPDRRERSPSGFGLVGIAERARLLGGELVVESAPGQGTTIRIVLDVETHHAPTASRAHR